MEQLRLISSSNDLSKYCLQRFSLSSFLVVASCLCVPMFAAHAAGETELEPEAVATLVEMSQYLRTLKTFQVRAETSDEDVFEDGQKSQYSGTTNFLVNLPHQLRIETEDDRHSRLFLFDGKTFTLFAKRANFYATIPAPESVGQLIGALDDEYGIEVPLVDFFRWGAPDWKPAEITGAMDLGAAVVDGVTCQHYAFRQAGVDWQIWIQKGDFPLPRKLVITTMSDEARPQHTARFSWNLAPSFNDAAFVMDPNSDAERVILEGLSAAGDAQD